MWIQGAYIYKVLEAFAPILPAFPKKNAKAGDYLSEPLPLTDKEAKQREEREIEEKANKGFDIVKSWANRVNTKRKQGDGNGN